MKKWQKRSIPFAVAIIAIAAAAFGIESSSAEKLAARHPLPQNPLAIAPDPKLAADGARLAHVNDCFSCHGEDLSGGVAFTGWFGTRLVAPNLTRLAHRQSAAQLAAAIRFGVKPDGTSLVDMPASRFIADSDSDTAAIVSYLRSLPVKPDSAGRTRWGFIGRAMLAMGFLPLEADAVDSSRRGPLRTPTAPLALGRYITHTQCTACHGPDLSGDVSEDSPDLRIAIRHYSLAAFEHFFRTGQGVIGHGTQTMTPAIKSQFKYLTDAQVRAIYLYLSQAGTAGRPGPQNSD
ncbi:MAG: c-type cytochrome [Rhizomicrobium sp.]